ncbi:MOSC domain-containing protein [Falsibacillus albus]|nr:MOSC domain-containing protein [Falsibacillus albus]
MKIIRVNVGKPKEHSYNENTYRSGISKRSVQEVMVTEERFVGDDVENHEYHGGKERAVCFYPYEHYQKWETEFNKTLNIPAFGENLTVTGMKEDEVFIGDIFQIGEAVIQICQGRIPCSTISKFNGVDPLLKRIIETGFTGYFGKVIKEGSISESSEIILIDQHPLQISILEANQTLFHDFKNKERLEKIMEVKELASAWKKAIQKKLMAPHKN